VGSTGDRQAGDVAGSATNEDPAITLRDEVRRQVAEATAARTGMSSGCLLGVGLASHAVEETTRTSYRMTIDKVINFAVGDTLLRRA
jgi:hypothetical protein